MTQSLKQTWDSESYQRDTGFVSIYGEDVLGWLEPKAGERILDLGCGDGALTRQIAAMGAQVTGVDASESFVASACASGVDARVMDGHALTFDNEFDAVFSNAALHWMTRPEAVLDGVAKAMRNGGRFVGEFGGFGNVAALASAMTAVGREMDGDTALAHPWFFPTTEEYGDMLQKAGFSVDEITSFYRPTPLPTGVRAWLKVMRAPFFDQFGERAKDAYDRVEEALKPSLCDSKGGWIADYVRLRFRATWSG